jgi:hypothetical protein
VLSTIHSSSRQGSQQIKWGEYWQTFYTQNFYLPTRHRKEKPQTNIQVACDITALQHHVASKESEIVTHTSFWATQVLQLNTHFTSISVFKRGPRRLRRYSYCLRAGRSGDRTPVGERFSALVQTVPGTHPASYTIGPVPISRGIKRPGRGVYLPPHLAPKLRKK